MTTSSFSPTRDQQARYALAILAGLGHNYSGPTAAQDTLDNINTNLEKLQGAIGTWTVVWGPGIFCSDPASSPDNLLFVAQQENTNNYVIAIAGTNFSGTSFDLLREDLAVGETVPWVLSVPHRPAPVGAAISKGAFLGLSILRKISTSEGAVQPGLTLEDFLKAESTKGPLNLCVSGHSLGGALAPTLALFLQSIQSKWDQSGSSTVMAMHIAGPTAGNKLFADYSNEVLTIDGFFNSLDVVPHAFAASDLGKLATIYGFADLLGDMINGIGAELLKLKTQHLHYTPLKRTMLTGTLRPDTKHYLEQAGFQHTLAYDKLFQVDSAALRAVPKPSTPLIQVPKALYHTVNLMGDLPLMRIVSPPTLQDVSVGKLTFQAAPSADGEQIRQAVTAMAPHFKEALGIYVVRKSLLW